MFLKTLLTVTLFLSGFLAVAETNLEKYSDSFDIKKLAPDFSNPECSGYKSSVQSFRTSSDLLSTWLYGGVENNPFRKSKACMIKSIDQSLGPLCEEERILKAELQEYRVDREIEEEIQEELQAIEEAKYEYAAILYEFADGADHFADTLAFKDTDNRWKVLSNLLTTGEARGYADVIAVRVRRLCGSTLKRPSIRPLIL